MSENLRETALEIVNRLDKAYPEAHQELNYTTSFELLIATILAAQCTDAKVNQVTKDLFKKYPDPQAYLKVDISEIEDDIKSITFYRNKAKGIVASCQMLVKDYDGQVPKTVEELVKLPWVGRKTANIVLANSMGIPAIGVDTHTIRVPNRLGLLDSQNPDKVEKALCELLPKEKWHRANIVIQWHGRYTCKSKKPDCGTCVVFELCKWPDKDLFK